MKKFIAALLTMALVLGMTMTSFASEPGGEGEGDDPVTPYRDAGSITITKRYKAANGVNPAETFSFSNLTCVSVTDAASGVTTQNAPVPTIGTVAFSAGQATSTGATATAEITLPPYTSVGVYTYSFNEVTPETKTAGVTYNSNTLYLVVTVIEQNGKVRVAAVHCEGNHNLGEYGVAPKTDVFENTYESGTLAVTKTVTGNLGDRDKLFNVTVTFSAAAGEAINSTITYTGGQYTTAQTVSGNTATIQVKHDDTVTFSNIPEGVTWTVQEANYSDEGYTVTYSENSSEGSSSNTSSISADGENDTCTITNNKEAEIDTGISMDSVPYILIIAAVGVAAIFFFVKKRTSAED